MASGALDLNPDEWVWNNVRNNQIGRSVIMSADDLRAKAVYRSQA
jgi:hypothetical protein